MLKKLPTFNIKKRRISTTYFSLFKNSLREKKKRERKVQELQNSFKWAIETVKSLVKPSEITFYKTQSDEFSTAEKRINNE